MVSLLLQWAFCFYQCACPVNKAFPSDPQFLFQSEIYVMVISSNFNMNEN